MDAMDPNDLVDCPYNKAHKMLRKKLQQHILKCREYYKNEVELLVCPFNKAHLIPEPEYFVSYYISRQPFELCFQFVTSTYTQQHTKSCSDRKIIAHYQHSAPAELNEETKHEKIEAEENWDEDDVPDYDPQAYVSQANLVREPNGLFPSQRKAFIKEERKRLLGEDSDDDADKKRSKTAPKNVTHTTSAPPKRLGSHKVSNRSS